MKSPAFNELSVPAWCEGPLRIVAIGGGSGLSTVLHGLKAYAHPTEQGGSDAPFSRPPLVEITAVVTVTDDGGSSGRLRRER